MRSARPISPNIPISAGTAGRTNGARWRVFSSRRKAARAKRAAQGRNFSNRRGGMSSTPPNANSSRQNPNSNAGEGSGSTSSVAMWPALPKLAPASPGGARSMSSTCRPSRASAQAIALPMTPAPRTAIVSCSAIRLPYTIYVRRETGLPCNGFASSIRTPRGEPTRLIMDGGPDLGSGPLEARAAALS